MKIVDLIKILISLKVIGKRKENDDVGGAIIRLWGFSCYSSRW